MNSNSNSIEINRYFVVKVRGIPHFSPHSLQFHCTKCTLDTDSHIPPTKKIPIHCPECLKYKFMTENFFFTYFWLNPKIQNKMLNIMKHFLKKVFALYRFDLSNKHWNTMLTFIFITNRIINIYIRRIRKFVALK